MAAAVGKVTWSLSMTENEFFALKSWLIRDDGEEHAAFLLCGISNAGGRRRFLVRSVLPVADDDFVLAPSQMHYRIAASAVARAGRLASDQQLAVVWVHSHPRQSVGTLSEQDLRTHGPAAEALTAITGHPVAALVLGTDGGTGIVSLNGAGRDDAVEELTHVRRIGRQIVDLPSRVRPHVDPPEERFSRQVQLFGASGQTVLRRLKVTVIGLGGGGSLLAQMLAHLGIGTIVLMDFDHVDESNLSRIVGSRPSDATARALKVDVAERLINDVDPRITVVAHDGDVRHQDDARSAADADFIFLATDTLFARFAFNVLCHQFMIPGIQVGAKVSSITGAPPTVHVSARPVGPGIGCLACAGGIPAEQLRDEQLSPVERQAQRYVDPPDGEEATAEASVITLNSVSAAIAASDFLLQVLGLMPPQTQLDGLVYYPTERALRHRSVAPRSGCHVCDPSASNSLAGRGDLWPLPLRPGTRRRNATSTNQSAAISAAQPMSRPLAWLLGRFRR